MAVIEQALMQMSEGRREEFLQELQQMDEGDLRGLLAEVAVVLEEGGRVGDLPSDTKPTAVAPAPPEEAFAPAIFDLDNGPIVFSADRRLDIEGIGTIEMAVSLPDFPGSEFPQVITLASHEDRGGNGFRLQIGAAGTRLGFYNGSEAKTLLYDFSAGGYFHIVLSVRGNETRVFVNGNHIGTLTMGFGSGRTMPLIVGGIPSGLDSFVGEFHYLRLWDIDFKRAEIKQTQDFFGQPVGLGALDDHLVAYTEFTSVRKTLSYARPLDRTDYLSNSSAGHEVDGSSAFALTLPDGTQFTGGSASFSNKLHSLSLNFVDENGITFSQSVRGTAKAGDNLPPCTPQPCASAISQGYQEILFADAPDVTGITTQLDADFDISSLVFHFDDGSSSTRLGFDSGTGPGFRQNLPEGTTFTGVVGEAGTYIHSMGPIFDPPLPFSDISGRWVLTLAQPPYKVPDADILAAGSSVPHGNYADSSVFMFNTSQNGQKILVSTRGSTSEYSLFDGSGIFINEAGRRLTFEDNETANMFGNPLHKVVPYPTIGPRDGSFNEFGGTFNLDNQVPFTAHMFRGYDVGFIDPENLQNTIALRGQVFKAPAPTSRDFYSSYQKIVPFGLLHFPDSREKSRKISRSVSSAHDYASQNSTSIGINIGVPKVASFGFNRTVQDRMDKQTATKSMFAVTKDLRTQRALVIDERHIELSDIFRDAVLDSARRIKLGSQFNPARLFGQFGTHYSNAMTVGTISVDRLTFSTDAYKQMYEKGVKIGVKAEATVKNVKAGGSFEKDNSFSDSVNNELEKQTEDIDAAGSELEPVPVFLDLRPLSDLLAPPHFFDSVITQKMRPALKAALESYLLSSPGARLAPEDIWEPYFFEIKFLTATAMGLSVNDSQGDPIVSPGITGFMGDFEVLGPKGPVKTQARILRGRQHDALNGGVFNVPGAGLQYMLTASEICGALVNGTRQGPAKASIGADMFVTFDDDFLDVNSLENIGFAGKLVLFRDMTRTSNILEIDQVADDIGQNVVRVKFSTRRLPSMDGNFKDMPQCQ